MPDTQTRNLRVPELLILGIGAFTHGIDRHLLTGLMPQVSADLHVSASTFGVSTAVFGAVFAIASPIIAALTETWERRLLLGISMVTFLVGILFQVTATQLPMLLIGSVLMGLSGSTYLPTAYGSAGVHSTSATRARSLAFVLGGASLALVGGVPVAIWIGQHYGWRSSLWILGAVAVAATVSLPLLSPLPVPPRQQGRWQILSDRRVLSILGITIAVMTPSFITFTYLATVLHGTPKLIPLAMLALGIGGVVGAVVAPRLINWRGAPVATLISVAGATLSLAVFFLMHGRPVGTLAPLFAVGIYNAVLVISQQHRLLAMVSETAAPFAIGLDGAAVYFGGALGAGIGGALLGAISVSAIVPASIAVGLVGITIATVARPERWRDLTQRQNAPKVLPLHIQHHRSGEE